MSTPINGDMASTHLPYAGANLSIESTISMLWYCVYIETALEMKKEG